LPRAGADRVFGALRTVEREGAGFALPLLGARFTWLLAGACLTLPVERALGLDVDGACRCTLEELPRPLRGVLAELLLLEVGRLCDTRSLVGRLLITFTSGAVPRRLGVPADARERVAGRVSSRA